MDYIDEFHKITDADSIKIKDMNVTLKKSLGL